jgi:type IV secretion system protein TrbC
MFAFREGAAKRTLADGIFGVGMAVGAANFMSWLFPDAALSTPFTSLPV